MESEAVMAQCPCERCGWPVDQPIEIVSRHPTTAGLVIYARCVCGLLRVWLRTEAWGSRSAAPSTRLLARGARPAVAGEFTCDRAVPCGDGRSSVG